MGIRRELMEDGGKIENGKKDFMVGKVYIERRDAG